MDLALTSWNVHGLPYPLDRHFWPLSRIPRYRVRVDAIAKATLALAPDIAVFQEAWRDAAVDGLCAAFQKHGYRTFSPPPGGFFRKGGLVACVRSDWEAVPEPFVEYRTIPPAASSDARVHKGIQTVRLRRGAERLTLLNTHLQSQYPPKRYAEIRRAQIAALTEHAQTLAEPGVPLFAVGDFNTYPYPSDYDVYGAISTGSWLDLTIEARAACGCETNYDPADPTAMEGWIDYVLVHRDESLRTNADVSLIRNRSIDNPYSDHHGLRVRLSVERVNRSTASMAVASAVLTRPTTRREWLWAMGSMALERPVFPRPTADNVR